MLIISRDLDTSLLSWLKGPNRQPLVLWGARQVGKTTAVQSFGAAHCPAIHVFNFQKRPDLHQVFEPDLQPRNILARLSLIQQKTIAPQDLVFFDEVQDCPLALTSLKYFCEEWRQQPVIAAGSFLGLYAHHASFPVGKVDMQTAYPLTFMEFLRNVDPDLMRLIREHFETVNITQAVALNASPSASKDIRLASHLHYSALQWWMLYKTMGGMPECISAVSTSTPFAPVDHAKLNELHLIQLRLLEGYRADFARYSHAVNANHLLRVFDQIAIQLGQTADHSVQRFRFSKIIPRKKGFDAIEAPLKWLQQARLALPVPIASGFDQPIRAYTQANRFKVYLFDTGLLHAALGLQPMIPDQEIGHYKGFIAENFVAQELTALGFGPLHAWEEGQSEVEFVIQVNGRLCPIEVKSSERSRTSKSLTSLENRYRPQLSLKVSGQNLSYSTDKPGRLNLPIYGLGFLRA